MPLSAWAELPGRPASHKDTVRFSMGRLMHGTASSPDAMVRRMLFRNDACRNGSPLSFLKLMSPRLNLYIPEAFESWLRNTASILSVFSALLAPPSKVLAIFRPSSVVADTVTEYACPLHLISMSMDTLIMRSGRLPASSFSKAVSMLRNILAPM